MSVIVTELPMSALDALSVGVVALGMVSRVKLPDPVQFTEDVYTAACTFTEKDASPALLCATWMDPDATVPLYRSTRADLLYTDVPAMVTVRVRSAYQEDDPPKASSVQDTVDLLSSTDCVALHDRR